MAQIINLLNSLLPYVVILAVGIMAAYPYAKQHNPAFADKMKWLYDIAQYISLLNRQYIPIFMEQKKAGSH